MSNDGSETRPPVGPSPHDAETPAPESSAPESSAPAFGLVDVIEAFTAMRHDWRGQSRDHRELVEEIQAVARQIAQLPETLAAPSANAAAAADDSAAAKLADSLAEIDWHLTRAAEAALAFGREQEQPVASPLQTAITQTYEAQGAIARWFSRRFYHSVLSEVESATDTSQPSAGATAEGLQLVVNRVRRILKDRQIERIDTVGKPFDAQQMNAIEAVESDQQPSGHVIEQLSPAYQWQGRLIRYAEVRIAK